MKIKAALIVLTLLTGCSREKSWQHQEIKTPRLETPSQSLTFRAKEESEKLELQFLQGSYGTLTYINAKSCIPRADKTAPVNISVDGTLFSFQAVCMQGNQRLLLPKEATDLLIESLSSQKKVEIALEGSPPYEIPSQDFKNL